MRMRAAVYGVVVVASVVISGIFWRELQTERQALRAEQQLTDQLRAQLVEAEGSRASGPPVEATTEIALAPAQAMPKSAVNAMLPGDLVAVVKDAASRQKAILDNSETRKARLAEVRATLKSRNPLLARELGISDREADAIFDILAENQLRDEARAASLAASGTPGDPAAIAESDRLLQAQQQERQDTLMAMLGPARYEQLQDIQNTQPARVRVNNVRTLLAQSGQPLTSDQQFSLTRVMAAEQKREEEESRALRAAGKSTEVSQVDRAVEGDRRILDNASGFLSAQQLEALRTRFEQRQAMERATGVVQARERATAQE